MESDADEQQTGIVIISLRAEYGSLNTSELADLEHRLREELDESPFSLLIDFGDSDYFGCALVNILLRCHARLKHARRRFALCGLKPLLQEMLAVTRLDSLWEVFPTRREAIAAMLRRLDDTELAEGIRVCRTGELLTDAT